jgi:Arc/MetJ family transcription regulator
MRTTLDVDPKLLDEVVETTGERSKSAAVNKALAEYVRRRRVAELREMAGTIDLVDNLKELEALELKELEQMQW